MFGSEAPSATPVTPTPTPAAPVTPSPAAPVAAPAPAQAPVSDPGFDQWKADMKRGAQVGANRLVRSLEKDSAGQNDAPIPSPSAAPKNPMTGLVAPHAAPVPAAGTPPKPTRTPEIKAPPTGAEKPPAEAQPAATPEKTPEPAADPSAPFLSLKADDGSEIALSREDVVNRVKGFNYYQGIVDTLEKARQTILGKEAEVKSQMQALETRLASDDGVILRALESHPQFHQDVLALLAKYPELSGQAADAKTNTELSQVKQDLEALKKANEEKERKAQETEQARIAEENKRVIDQTVTTIRTGVAEILKTVPIPMEFMEVIDHKAIQLVQRYIAERKTLPPVPEVLAWYKGQIENTAKTLKSREDALINQHLSGKAGVPPAPPANGGTPPVSPPQVTSFGKSLTSAVANKFNTMVGGK